MSVITLKAHYDGKAICPDEPCAIPPNVPLTVTVLTDENLGMERQAWHALSEQGLARAYGEDEPDYSGCIGKPFPAE